MAVTESGEEMWQHLSSVDKLFGFIVIDSKYFQKWVWLAEEILQMQRK